MLRKLGGRLAVLLAAILFAAKMPVNADTTQTFSKWVEDIKFSGDMRIRQEMFDKRPTSSASSSVDRNRLRFRLRVNTDVKVPNNFLVRFTFASGTGEQVSTNQSFDNLSSQKPLWIDKAYLVWQPLSALKFQAGRMENPIWRQYSSDAVWDSDFNPEGFSESYSQLLGPVNVFVNALQMVVDEDGGNNNVETISSTRSQMFPQDDRDQWMFGNQIGGEIRLPAESRLKVSYANYNWVNERYGDFGAGVINEGNRRSTNTVVNNFNVDEFTGVLSSWLFRIPVQVQGTYIVNRGARDSIMPDEDTGWQVGGIIGKAGPAKGWEVAFFQKHVRTDATIADVADSDFGDGGTNREGHIMWVGYSPTDWLLVSAKYFQTKVINPAIQTPSTGADDVNRTQFDFIVKF